MLSSFYIHNALVISCVVFTFSFVTFILRLENRYNLFQDKQTGLIYDYDQILLFPLKNLSKHVTNFSLIPANELYLRKEILGSDKKKSSILDRFTYINPSKSICTHLNYTNNSLIIVVLSPAVNFDYREAIRATWGRKKKYKFSNIYIQTIFFVGTDDSVQLSIRNEQEMLNDVIEIGIPEKYTFSAHKELASLLWTRLYCPLARIVFRIDDSMLLDIFLLINYLQYQLNLDSKDGLYGWFRFNSGVLRHGRSAVTKREYEPDIYPPYTVTTGYLFSNSTCQRLIEAANQPEHQIVPIGDAYITGILRELADIPFYTYSNLEHAFTYTNQMSCDENFERRPRLLVCTSKLHMGMHGDPYEYYDIWDVLLTKHNKSMLTL